MRISDWSSDVCSSDLQAECNSCAHRTHTGSPWVGSIKNGAIEIRDRQGKPVVTIHPDEELGLSAREFALANLIVASPDLADFAQEFIELFAGRSEERPVGKE